MKKEMNNFNAIFQDDDESINFRELFEKYLFYWKWFFIAGVLSILAAYFYLRYTPQQYQVSSTILIDDEKNGGLSSELSAFEDLGLIGGSQANIDNEIGILRSRSLMETVVKELQLNVSIFNVGKVADIELYKDNAPFAVVFGEDQPELSKLGAAIRISILSKESFNILNEDKEIIGKYAFGELVTYKWISFKLSALSTIENYINEELFLYIRPLEDTVESYKNAVSIEPNDKKSSLINLSMTFPIRSKAKDIIDKLVEVYNKNAIEDKSSIAKDTDIFITERLDVIREDLSVVDKGVETFKTTNKLTNIQAESQLILSTNSNVEQKIVDLNTQLKLVEFVSKHVQENTHDLVPSNLGLADANLNASTLKYNELLLNYNRLKKGSGKLNPILLNLEDQIGRTRVSILQSLSNLESTVKISLKDIQKQDYRLNSKISSVPRQEREYRDIERQQKITETLFLYLLEKREENAISLAVTAPNAKIIDAAHGSKYPVSPKRKIVYLAFLLVGLIIPIVILYIKFLLDNKVHSRKDIEAVVKAPYIGDIPKYLGTNKIVVGKEERSGIAESFRMLRTNLDFMLVGFEGKSKTIFVTSTVSGEGKTFIAVNLASVLALSNKKVLLIGSDLRKPKLEEYLDIKFGKGLSHYLTDTSLLIKNVISTVKNLNIDVIHAGVVAPNPSELLQSSRFEEVLKYGKEHYDYVIVDTSPVKLVTDTLLISKHADLFLYAIRADYLDKRMLEIPALLYEEKRLSNMAVVLNDIDLERGYVYGYGYGYGEELTKKSWWKKLLKL
ncbi:GumC family protein [Lutibacter citreus]|uniref:GumC family protein n=1 Tax=Lutibacter citreus TaxID=2138210 RepID=UPI000DBE2FB9|nr:tyrosine-protein kinase [Lutibacter citreus]